MNDQPDHRTLWTIERLMFGGEDAGFLIKEEGTTRSYTVKENQLPQALLNALTKKVKARYRGGWDNKLNCVEGPVEVIPG